MGNLDAIQKFLTRDPVMQAMFEAELLATNKMQLSLLDAVLMSDANSTRKILEEEDHSRLLEDDFFLALSILLVGKSSAKVVQEFQDCGYDSRFRPSKRGVSSDLTLGDIALWTCTPARQKELVDAGFLSVKSYHYSAMGSADPDIFDLWSDLYLAGETPRKKTTPQAGLAIFRWLPESARATSTQSAMSVRGEIDRRLSKMVGGFLRIHYPSTDSFDRWKRFLDDPPSVSANASNTGECVVFMKVLVDHQLSLDPDLRSRPVSVSFANPQSLARQAHLANALLKSGYALSDFQGDLAGQVLQSSSKILRSGENPPDAMNYLWRDVSVLLRAADPDRFKSLPQEITSEGRSLQLLRIFRSDEERVAFCDMLDMEIALSRPAIGSAKMRF